MPLEAAIVTAGESNWSICISADAAPGEQYAAKELQQMLMTMSGVSLPIVTTSSGPTIYLGRQALCEADALPFDWDRLGADGYILDIQPDRLFIAGRDPRGTLYGVYALLRDRLGCRFWAPDAIHIPYRADVTLPVSTREAVPRLEYREPFNTQAWDGDWAARNQANGTRPSLDERHGGAVRYGTFVHTFDNLVPVDRYFASHPEYFSEVDGQRIKERTQLCLTNPEVLALAVAGVKEWIHKHPHASIFSVSQNDWRNPCQCSDCEAIDEAEGSHAGSLLYFVNQVADAIAKDHPHIAIDTLAYQYTRQPPKTLRPRENVIIRLCTIECCFSHSLETCSPDFAADLQGWSAISSRLYIWDYITNFRHYLMPFPNLRILADNVRFFLRNGVKGIFEQGNHTGGPAELAELRAYLLARLLYEPELDEKQVMDGFLTGFYQEAAPAVSAYIDRIHDHVAENNLHVRIFDPPTQELYPPELIAAAEELLADAERTAPNDVVRTRVQRLQLSPRYLKLWFQPNGPEKVAAFRQFAADAQALGIRRVTEWADLDKTVARWEQDYA